MLEHPSSQYLCLSEPQTHSSTAKHHYYKLSSLNRNARGKARSSSCREPCFYANVLLRFQLKQFMSILPNNFYLFFIFAPFIFLNFFNLDWRTRPMIFLVSSSLTLTFFILFIHRTLILIFITRKVFCWPFG